MQPKKHLVFIKTEFITLGQFLKFANIISSGAHAKFYLSENKILVNGEDENRRGRKLYHDSTILIDGSEYQIVRGEENADKR